MKLKSVTMQNFKGIGAFEMKTVTLSGFDILTGENGSGKTRILQAIQLAVFGYVPHQFEPRAVDVAELFTKGQLDTQMTVGVQFEGGAITSITRTFMLTKTGAKQSVIVEPFGEQSKISDSEKLIKEYCSDMFAMVDFRDFVRLSEDKRAEVIFNILESSNVTKLSVAQKIFVDKNPEGVSNEAKLLVDTTWGKLSENVRESLNEFSIFLKKKLSELRKEKTGAKGAALSTAEEITTDGKQALRPTDIINEELTKAKAEEQNLTQRIMESRASKTVIDTLRQRKSDLENSIEGFLKLLPADDIDNQLQPLLNEAEAQRNHELCAAEIEKEREHLTFYEKKLTEASTEMRLHTDNMKILSEHRTCPVCKTHVSDSVLDEHARMADDLVDANNEAAIQKNSCLNRLQSLSETFTQLTDEWHDIQGKNDERKKFNERIFIIKKAAPTNQAKIEKATAELKTVNAELNAAALKGTDTDAGELQLEGIRQSVKTLEEELKVKRDYDTRVVMMREQAIKGKKALAEFNWLESIEVKVDEQKRAIVQSALSDISDKINYLLNAVYNEKDAFYIGLTADRFSFGKRVYVDVLMGEEYVDYDFDTLSTAQQFTLLVAMLSPLISIASPKFRMLIMDNVEAIDESSVLPFLRMTERAKEMYLDNIIYATSREMNFDGHPDISASVEVVG